MKIVKVPIVAHRKSKIEYNLWYIGSYNGDNSSYSYTIDDEEKSRYIKADKLIKKVKQDKLQVYQAFIARAVDPVHYLRLLARDPVKRSFIYNNPSQADESVCIALYSSLFKH